ncbi:hypothetical protein K7I13_12180 [Brucepastera parasyntrophica]|uniref:hypothetical protein n=1 Tax=Brucepastera parasyntrophica TaxID=2880008 RepID=UPI00210CD9C6|nr:hypothetical protein [Brucepastera parasyntrophica]ULQ59243.1 hypothetical protein K7I13_12180 [Brucepastera parasyntrophica]
MENDTVSANFWQADTEKMICKNIRNGMIVQFSVDDEDSLEGKLTSVPEMTNEEILSAVDPAVSAAHLMNECGEVFRAALINSPNWFSVRHLKAKYELTGEKIAELLKVSPVTVRRWLMSPNIQESRKIPYAAWELLRLKIGETTLE